MAGSRSVTFVVTSVDAKEKEEDEERNADSDDQTYKRTDKTRSDSCKSEDSIVSKLFNKISRRRSSSEGSNISVKVFFMCG